MTTTTTAAREAAKNLAIYNAIAEHARRAFEALELLPGQYTPAQVIDLLKKSRARWNDDADRREVARVEVEGFACSFLLADVFAVLAQVATAYEIPTAARVTFERAAETAPAAVSFTITKTAAAEVAKAVAKKDPDRAALEFAYIDTDRRALVGTNGHVLTVAPLSSLSVAEGARHGYFVARCLLKADRVTIDTNNNATDGARVAESPAWLRFPAWSSVFPAVCDTDALTIDAKTRRELSKAVAAATKFAGEELTGCRLVSIFAEGYTSKIVIRSRREVAAPTADDPTATRYDVRDSFVQLPAELSRSFALTFHGPDFAALPAFDKMYITPDAGRAAVFAGPHAVAVLIPQPLPDTAERVCSTDSRPTWAKAVDPLADLLAAAPAADSIETPAAETITAAPAEVAAPAADLTAESEAETIETPAAPAADNEAPAFGEWCPLTGETLTPAEQMTADEIRAEVAAERERLAAADSQTTDDTPAEVAAPAALTAAAELLTLAEFRDAAKAIAKAKTADDYDSQRAARDARRLLTTAHGLTVSDYKIKTADGLTLTRFIYTYGKKSRRTLCAPLLKVAAEFATLESLADEWAELTAAATADSIESESETIETPAAEVAAPAADLTAESEAETIEADPLPLLSIDTAAGVIVWGLADELHTADDLTADTITPADLLTIATADSQTAESRAERRPLLLTIARHALRLAAAAALLLLLTIAPDRAADTLAAPADLTAAPAPADVLTIAPDTLTAAAPAADSIETAADLLTADSEAESRAELADPADSPRPAAERRHAPANKRESHARALLTVATADSIAAPLLTIEADTLTAAPLLLTADSIEADTLAAGSTLESTQEITDTPTDDTDSEADTITTDDEPTDDTPAAADSSDDTATSGHPHAHGSTPATMAAPCSPSAPLAPVAPVLI